MKARTFVDKVIAYKKEKIYIAVSLEFDLIAEGKSIMQALERLHDATSGYLEMCCKDNETDEEIYRKAPKKFQDMYDLFVELSEKKRKRDDEKLKEKKFREKETLSQNITYNSNNLCNA
ncbi:hypothetical protein GF354_01910 [Candidatus Peregrinibacteria bacterium]|nr:hypothetical protein [Candidatus Peregrinibacteria bacterium]